MSSLQAVLKTNVGHGAAQQCVRYILLCWLSRPLIIPRAPLAAASQTTPRPSTSSGIHTWNEGIFVRRSATPRQAVVSLLPPNALNKLMGRPTGSKLQELHTVQYIGHPGQYTFAQLSGFGGASPQTCKTPCGTVMAATSGRSPARPLSLSTSIKRRCRARSIRRTTSTSHSNLLIRWRATP